MQSLLDRTEPYPIRLPSEQSHGELHVGWRSFPVKVIDISWRAITVSLPSHLARRMRLHSKVTLWHQGNQWKAVIERPSKNERGTTTISLALSDQDDRVASIRRNLSQKSAIVGELKLNSDPVVVAVVLVAVCACFLVMPGWGERWGTTDIVTDSVTDFCKNFSKFITDMF